MADGNWKLRYAHCMWKVPVTVAGFGKVNYPSICPLSPKRGHAFCEAHCKKAQAMGYGTGLKDLYKRCGVTGVNIGQGTVCIFSNSHTIYLCRSKSKYDLSYNKYLFVTHYY